MRIALLELRFGLRGPVGLVDLRPERGQVGQRFGVLLGRIGIEQIDFQEGQQGVLGFAGRLVAIAQRNVGPGVQLLIIRIGLVDHVAGSA